MRTRWDGGKQARWLELVRRWQRSELSVREFCQRRQISANNFYAWRRVLRERGLFADAPAKAAPAFVQLWHGEPSADGVIEVVLGRRLVRVRPGFDVETLRRLLALLEEPAC